MDLINLNLVKNPLNWIIVLLMLVIFGMFADLVVTHYVEVRDTMPDPGTFA